MKKLVAAIGTLALASGAAFAADQAKDTKAFQELDKDDNGALTKQEASADRTVAAIFNQADTNQDGYLTKREFDRVMNEKEDAE